MIHSALIETASGWVGVALSDNGIRAVTLPEPDSDSAARVLLSACPEIDGSLSSEGCVSLGERLEAFLNGDAADLGIPLDVAGTPFQHQVWDAIAAIPRGETRSYAWIAEQIGRPRAVRAVGQAVGANRVPLLIPCHRVIASNGGLGGFAGGLEMKRALLCLEGVGAR